MKNHAALVPLAFGTLLTVFVAAPAHAQKFVPTNQFAHGKIHDFDVSIHTKIVEDKELLHDVQMEVARQLRHIEQSVPEDALKVLRQVRVWVIQHGTDKAPVAEYHPDQKWLRNNGYNTDMVGGIGVPDARRFLDMSGEEKHFNVLLHEMTHAYEFKVLGPEHPELKANYQRAINAGLYRDTYYSHSHHEYFAELTEAYFGKNDFFPRTKEEAREYDPRGVEFLEKAWGVRNEVRQAEAKPAKVNTLVESAATEEAQLVTPQLTKPTMQAAEGDPLSDKYEASWRRYEQALGEVRVNVMKALDAQFEKAADAGNLDLADMWDKKRKFFTDTGAVFWPSDAKTKVEWRKRHEDSPFPNEFTEVIAAAKAKCERAVATLKEDYESLVKEHTKGRNLARAKALRDELAGLAGASEALGGSSTTVGKKPEREQKPGLPRDGQELQRFLSGSAWKNQTGFTFEWDSAGRLWHCKDGGRTAVTVSYSDGRRCAIEFVNGAQQILVFRDDFSAFEQRSLDGKVLQPALRVR